MSRSFCFATVSVAVMEDARRLWVDAFGLQPRQVPWQQGDTSAIEEELYVGSPNQTYGLIRLVKYACPGEPVRRGAATTDLCPKNLDLYCTNLPERFDELTALGYQFRARWSEYEVAGNVVREVQLLGPDETNIGLMELQHMPVDFTSKGFAGLGPVVCTVPDADAECAFYENVFGLKTVIHKYLDGAEIEKMIGLPPGAGLDMRVLGSPDQMLGRVEIIQYRGAEGKNRYPRAVPPATGTLSLAFRHADLVMPTNEVPTVEAFSTQSGSVLVTPAGMRVHVLED